MTLTELTWLATGCYAFHAFEEFTLNWRDWARAVIKLPVEWADFYVVNFVVVVLGIVASELAASQPMIALAFPALMLINAVVFHIAQVVRARGRFSPGVITAVILFLPVGTACFLRASADGVLDAGTAAGAFVIAALLMASPIVFLHMRSRPYFRQDA